MNSFMYTRCGLRGEYSCLLELLSNYHTCQHSLSLSFAQGFSPCKRSNCSRPVAQPRLSWSLLIRLPVGPIECRGANPLLSPVLSPLTYFVPRVNKTPPTPPPPYLEPCYLGPDSKACPYWCDVVVPCLSHCPLSSTVNKPSSSSPPQVILHSQETLRFIKGMSLLVRSPRPVSLTLPHILHSR